MKESEFQKDLIKEIKTRLPGCMVLKNDPTYIQGVPDLLILSGGRWGALEVKKNKKASHQPNQDVYVEKMNNMSFASFIYPENKEDVLDEMERTFKSKRSTRSVRA